MTIALVLGATGFIGGHVALAALDRGWSVRGLRRDPTSAGHLGQARLAWFQGDLDRPESLAPALDGAEIVFHAGAYYPTSGRNVPGQVARAVRQARGVIEAARRAGVRRLVYTSSLTTIGSPPPGAARLADERDLYLPGSIPRSAYYECKYAMESEFLRAAAEGLPVVVVNPTAVFGPGDWHLALGGLLLAVARGWGVVWVPATTNAVDVRDVAQAQVRAAEVGRTGERYLLGGHNASVRQLLLLAAEAAGARPPRAEVPLGLIDALVWLNDRLPGLDLAGNHLRALRHWQALNCDKARGELGLDPRPLQVTLREALDWYAAHGHLAGRRSVV